MERTILEDDKHTVKTLHPREEWNIIAATVARLYVAYPDPNRWTYTNIVGALTFTRNELKNSHFFRIVDLSSGRGLLWEQELYEGFAYQLDLSFFHSFSADNYVAGFSFANEHEANLFYKRVTTRGERNKQKIRTVPIPGAKVAATGPASEKPSSSMFDSLTRSKTKKKERPRIDKSMIGQPQNFQHLGHIGWDPQKGFSAENVPPDWKHFLARAGVSEDALKDAETAKFVVDFVQSHGGIAAATRSVSKPDPAAAPAATVEKAGKPGPPRPPPAKMPAEAPAPGMERVGKRPPPPPPPRQRGGTPGAAAQPKQGVPPPPPPRVLAAPETVPTPGRLSPVPAPSVAPPPPLVAPPGPPPPPPPPPQAATQVARPPPTPQSAKSSASPRVPGPAAGIDRSDLLASIRSAGGIGALKPSTSREQPSSSSPAEESAGAGDGDLASALAAALSARSKAMADESDEEEDDEEWDD